MPRLTSWSVKIVTLFSLLTIMSLSFHITHIMSVIFNSVNQYLISVSVNNLLKNSIDSINIDTEDSFNDLRFSLT